MSRRRKRWKPLNDSSPISKSTRNANRAYRGMLQAISRKRYSKPNLFDNGFNCTKILTFNWDLFMTDIVTKEVSKTDLIYGNDYLILRGSFAGRIARYIGTEPVKCYGSFMSVRGNKMRVRCDKKGFATVPKIGCWMEYLSSTLPLTKHPPILLLQAKSIVGEIPTDAMHFAIRDGNDLVAQWTYHSDFLPETIDLPKLESTITSLGRHKRAHRTLRSLVKRGFYVCYEDDGWLIKCDSKQRIRFMRRSHMFQITVCRCGKELVDAMMNDYILRSLLPVYMFAGLPGIKQKQRPGMLQRRSSTLGDFNSLDLSDFLDDYDKSSCYERIFRRCGSVVGNCLILDTQYLDGIRSYISNGGLARNCICPNILKWRRMVKYTSGADEPYLLMSDIRIVNCQWIDLVTKALPNSRYRKYSFSTVYYDGTTKIMSSKIAHKFLQPLQPKNDLRAVFQQLLIMNGGYLIIALSRRDVSDESLPVLFENVEQFVHKLGEKYGYKCRRIALGLHMNLMIYVDFQLFLVSSAVDKSDGSGRRIKNGTKGYSVQEYKCNVDDHFYDDNGEFVEEVGNNEYLNKNGNVVEYDVENENGDFYENI